jgi:PrkA AAA domain
MYNDSLFNAFVRSFEARSETDMSMAEYLEFCRGDPMRYANAAERLLAAIGDPQMIDTAKDPRRGRIFLNRPARCCSTGSGRRDLDLMIRGPAFTPFITSRRARALMARPWSARCYGVARPREGSRQNSIGGSGVLSLRHSGWFSLSLCAWAPKNLPRRKMQIMAYGFGRRDAARPARAAGI